jgi:hypothetical protein
MYCAGFFTVETVVSSTPEDIASVTGIPVALARRIHEETARYATEMKTRAVDDIVTAVEGLKKVLPRFSGDDTEMMNQVKVALADLQQTLRTSPWGGMF